MSNNTTDMVLGYNEEQVRAVTFELQNTVLDLINLSEEFDPQYAVDTVVTGLALRVAILERIVTQDEASELILAADGDMRQITEELSSRALSKLLGE